MKSDDDIYAKRRFTVGGQEFCLAFSVADALRIRNDYGVTLFRLIEQNGHEAERLAGDPITLVAILWDLCRRQAEARGLTPETFAALFAGEEDLTNAVHALAWSVLFFYPPGRRELLAAAWQTSAAKTDATALEIAHVVAEAAASLLVGSGNVSGELPPSPASTQDLTPSET